ncbi:hypothetical protein [Gordonia sihwensis]|uniref:hypothetical protein n=1 Tax=Gordonia sihwensis TaxID=173559 RepID=UPI003D955D0F
MAVINTRPGEVTITDAESILGHSRPLTLTPDKAIDLANQLEADGTHTVAAEGIRRAAAQASNA